MTGYNYNEILRSVSISEVTANRDMILALILAVFYLDMKYKELSESVVTYLLELYIDVNDYDTMKGLEENVYEDTAKNNLIGIAQNNPLSKYGISFSGQRKREGLISVLKGEG